MEEYAKALNFAIPLFVSLIIIEQVIAVRRGLHINRGADMIASLSSGLTNIVKDVLGISVAIVSYGYLVEHLAIYKIQATWLMFVIAFVAKDFAGYWIHRFEHEFNLLWNRHVVHHSSEEFNLSCALRQSISAIVGFLGLFMLPAAVLGVPKQVMDIIIPLHLFGQFWYHTRVIGRMGWLEYFLVTPSHHRVHHAINPTYIDKNYGQIFIVWDKMFGTFQAELDNEPPVYGVKKPAQTWNPILINFQHLGLLAQDAWHARHWRDKLKIWFMPTGWRPADVEISYPRQIVNDPRELNKYDTNLSSALLYWSWFQYIMIGLLTLYMFNRLAAIGIPNIYIYGLYLLISVYSMTTLMDKNRRVVGYELVRFGFGVGLMVWQGGWFKIAELTPLLNWCVAAYFVVSILGTMIFATGEVRQYQQRYEVAKG